MSDAIICVRAALTDCWACGAETRIVSSVMLSLGAKSAECGMSDFTAYPHLVAPITRALPAALGIGALKMRSSKTLNASYVSNGCAHCDALFGQHFETPARYGEETACEFARPASEGWEQMIDDLLASEDGRLFRG